MDAPLLQVDPLGRILDEAGAGVLGDARERDVQRMGRGERLPDGQRAVGEVGTGRQQRQLDRIAEVTMEPEQRLDARRRLPRQPGPGHERRCPSRRDPDGSFGGRRVLDGTRDDDHRARRVMEEVVTRAPEQDASDGPVGP